MTLKLSPANIDTQAQAIANGGDRAFGEVQATIYAMIGGGFLGQSAIRQPRDFYIDTRVGRLGYSRAAILQAVAILARAADLAGVMGPGSAPEMPDYRTFRLNLGAF